MQMSFSIEPPKINATMKNDGFDYKYSADIKYKVNVTKLPKNQPVQEPVTEYVKEKAPNPGTAIESTVPNSDWEQLVAEKGPIMAIILVIASSVYWIATKGMPTPNFATMPPFTHTIDPYNQYPPNA
jgi:hypothetical protein